MEYKLPLVSILIPNFNHSKYLDECIQSALNQTYPNKEIILLDNMSTDDSILVAKKYLNRGVQVCRNQCNVMNYSYKILANQFCKGKYFVLLCADDYLLPDFLKKAVNIMEKYPTVGYVHGERDFVTETGEVIELDPFYNCSFIAPGQNTMPIYMVTTVAHPSQALVRKAAFCSIGGYDMEIDHMNADRSLWFFLSYEHDAGYIREKTCRIRVGTQTETVITQQNFQHPILCHLTLNLYIKFAKEKGLTQVYKREQEAIERLAKEFVGYAGGMIYQEDWTGGERYLNYATILCRAIQQDKQYICYRKMCKERLVDRTYIEKAGCIEYWHKRSYEPPEGYEEIYMEEIREDE